MKTEFTEDSLIKGELYLIDEIEKAYFSHTTEDGVYFKPLSRTGYMVTDGLIGFNKSNYNYTKATE